MARFACPLCKSVISVEAEQRGTVIACTSCEKRIRVPAGKSSSAVVAKQGAARDKSADTEERKRQESFLARKPAPMREADTDAPTEADVESAEDIPVRPAATRSRAPKPEDDAITDRPKPPSLSRKRAAEIEEEEEFDEDMPRRKKPRPGAKKRRRDEEDDELEEDDSDREGEDDEDEDRPRKRRKGEEKEGGAFVAVTGFISSITALAAIAFFILIVSGRGPRWLMDFIEEKLRDSGIPPILAVAITTLVFLIPLGLWVLLTMKGQILSAMPDELDFRTTKTSKFPDLDIDQLDQITADLEALGFVQVVDYTVKTELENFPSGFARLFVNDEEGCYAEVNQGFTPSGDAVPMRCVIVSHMEDDWALSTTDRTPSKESYLMRRPRHAWRSLPDKEPEALLTHHRKMRKKMMKALKIELDESLSKDAYFAREKEANRERKDVVRGRWTAGILLEFFFFDRNPKFEWLGEYAGASDD